MSEGQLADVLRVCHRYPDIQLTYQMPGGASVAAGNQVQLVAELERDWSEGDLPPVDAPRYAPERPHDVSHACTSVAFLLFQIFCHMHQPVI